MFGFWQTSNTCLILRQNDDSNIRTDNNRINTGIEAHNYWKIDTYVCLKLVQNMASHHRHRRQPTHQRTIKWRSVNEWMYDTNHKWHPLSVNMSRDEHRSTHIRLNTRCIDLYLIWCNFAVHPTSVLIASQFEFEFQLCKHSFDWLNVEVTAKSLTHRRHWPTIQYTL